MFDGFFNGFKFAPDLTDKQKLENRIKDSVLNLVIDRDRSFLGTARAGKTSVIVNNRDGGIQEFTHQDRRYISFPSSMEAEFTDLDEFDAEEKMDSLLKISTYGFDKEHYDENEMDLKLENKVKGYETFTGSESGFEIEKDEDGKILNNPLEYKVTKSSEDEDKENEESVEDGENGSSGSCDLTQRGMHDGSSGRNETKAFTKGNYNEREYSFQDSDLDIGSSTPQETKENRFYGEGYSGDTMSSHREEKLKSLASMIAKSFKGRVSKHKTIVPSKRLVSKALVRDDIEKMYANKKGVDGKQLNINLIIDMSGSMDGHPVNNAVEMIYIFNEIANKGYLNGCVIWSETGSRCKVNFPMPREMIKNMRRTGGGEGLGENLKHYKNELKKADTNICMTDGQLTNDPILKEMYAREKIDIIGVYVNPNAKDLTQYTGSLNRWFTRSLVRNTTEELCEKLIQFSLRKKK